MALVGFSEDFEKFLAVSNALWESSMEKRFVIKLLISTFPDDIIEIASG